MKAKKIKLDRVSVLVNGVKINGTQDIGIRYIKSHETGSGQTLDEARAHNWSKAVIAGSRANMRHICRHDKRLREQERAGIYYVIKMLEDIIENWR